MHFIFKCHESSEKIWITWFFHFITPQKLPEEILNLVKFYSVYQSLSIKMLSHYSVFHDFRRRSAEYSYASLFPLTFLSLCCYYHFVVILACESLFKLCILFHIQFFLQILLPHILYFECFCNYFLHGCEENGRCTKTCLSAFIMVSN